MNQKHLVALLLFSLADLVGFQACREAGKPAVYGAELEECNRTSDTCAASIACENLVRAKYKRPLRDAATGCK